MRTCARSLWMLALLTLGSMTRAWAGLPAAALPALAAGMNETVVAIPADASASAALETTIFKPDGPGPFPLVVFNHGRDAGDPHAQPRSRPLSFAREFVRRGYVVAVPNRRGFAQSTGHYPDTGCDLEADGIEQARDIAATVDAMSHTGYVDPTQVLIAGVSHGGFASLAYGDIATQGVRGVLNFSGGLRKDACVNWRDALAHAFTDFGARARVPSLWFYGSNDRVFDAALVATLYRAYTASGGLAARVDYGPYKDNAHGLVGDRDAVAVWWPATARFLREIGMPDTVRYRVADTRDARPPARASGYAPLDAVQTVPYLNDAGRIGYLTFLAQPRPRVFAISRGGRWAWASGGDDPFAEAIDNCSQNSPNPCKAYAIDDIVVWRPE